MTIRCRLTSASSQAHLLSKKRKSVNSLFLYDVVRFLTLLAVVLLYLCICCCAFPPFSIPSWSLFLSAINVRHPFCCDSTLTSSAFTSCYLTCAGSGKICTVSCIIMQGYMINVKWFHFHMFEELQPRIPRHTSQGLPDSKIQQHVLRSTKESIERYHTMVMFDKSPHPSFGNTPSTKYLYSIPSGLLRGRSRVALQERDLPCQFACLLFIRHIAHLVRDIFQPILYSLRARNHRRNLRANNSL